MPEAGTTAILLRGSPGCRLIEPRRFTVREDDAGQRVDRFLRKLLVRATLPAIFKLLRTGRVRVDGGRVKPERRLDAGEVVEIRLPPDRVAELLPPRRAEEAADAAGAVDVVWRDQDVMVVNKPALLPVHPGDAGEADHLIGRVQALVAGERRSHTFRPALAHRLDQGTSGLVLVGLSARGLRGLSAALKARAVRKEYLALVLGSPAEDEGRIDVSLKKRDEDRGRETVVYVSTSKHAAAADTRWRVMKRGDGLTLLAVRIVTGRTHQIRVHLAHLGHPIAGDARYGDRLTNERLKGAWGLWRPFLHAWRLELDHPVTGERLAVAAPLPRDLVRVLEGVRIPTP